MTTKPLLWKTIWYTLLFMCSPPTVETIGWGISLHAFYLRTSLNIRKYFFMWNQILLPVFFLSPWQPYRKTLYYDSASSLWEPWTFMSGTLDLKSLSSFLAFSPCIKYLLYAEYSNIAYQEGCTKTLAFWKYWKRYNTVLLNKWKISILPTHFLPHIHRWMVPIKVSGNGSNVALSKAFLYVHALLIIRCLEFMWPVKCRVPMTNHSPFILLLWMHPKVRLAESVGTFSSDSCNILVFS